MQYPGCLPCPMGPRFIAPSSQTGLPYNQVYLDCQSDESRVRRVLHSMDASYSTAKPSSYTFSETRIYSGDTANDPATFQPGNGWNEQHLFGPSHSRFILRVGQVHCVQNYDSVGGQNDNPRLGQYGRVWPMPRAKAAFSRKESRLMIKEVSVHCY